jgi:Tfp pilus assembly protein PilF
MLTRPRATWTAQSPIMIKVIDLDPKYARAYRARGEVYKVKGDINRAMADFQKSAELKPN